MQLKQIIRSRKFIKRSIVGVVLLFVVIAAVNVINNKLTPLIEALTPPQLADIPIPKERHWLRNQQNWSDSLAREFHHKSQGTRTLPMSLSWFLALEEPHSGVLTTLLGGKNKPFARDEYLLRFGFIQGEKSKHNPYALPLGFAVTPAQSFIGINDQQDAIGFTCAACHTGHLTYDGVEYIVEGGPATTDLGLLTEALGSALGQTLVSAKIPFGGGRFERFAKKVLGDGYDGDSRDVLQKELEVVVKSLADLPTTVAVIEGYTRLDALNRIGNQVFAWDPLRSENYVAINAPVNYPHIWTASWFNWVQYDGSIVEPLVRNVGEALGVSAFLNTTAPLDQQRFASSVNVRNLAWIEKALSGDAPWPQKRFSGLLSPPWPESFPAIDRQKAERGKQLYATHCQGCHLPPLNSTEIWADAFFKPIEFQRNGQPTQTRERLLQLKMIPHGQIGTDGAQGSILVTRTINSAATSNNNSPDVRHAIGIDADLCTQAPAPPALPSDNEFSDHSEIETNLVDVHVGDSPNVNYALALGAIVQQTIDRWFAQNYIAPDQRELFSSDRPNCLQAGSGYKARPLNGVWATAPFLHNGSVPTVDDLLKPAAQRPALVQLGSTEFDPVKLGIKQDEHLKIKRGAKYADGRFILDTHLSGNRNTGHEFSDEWDPTKHYSEQKTGVIGPALSDEERAALIEFLKTL